MLHSEVLYNHRFRDKLPPDQFDDSPSPDWFVVWDPKDRTPKQLDERYELVWEHGYSELRSIWKWGDEPRQRDYRVYRLR